jgi:transcriptional regulator with XRE-family HTH domain
MVYGGDKMNAIRELRKTTNMSQSRFATYLGIPVANIQHWEQGVSSPPNYLVSLISRVMRSDGYIQNELRPEQIDAIRQMQATLAIEDLLLSDSEISGIADVVTGTISREEFQRKLKENYSRDGKHR